MRGVSDVEWRECAVPVLAPQLGLLVMDDGKQFGDNACARIHSMRPTSVRLALQGAPDRAGMRTVATVPDDRFTYRTAIADAADEGYFWVVGPRDLSDPLSMMLDCAVAASAALDANHPGFAVALLDSELPTRKVALVADVKDPITTGQAAWAAVAAALLFGATLDVLVLGQQPDAKGRPADWREALDLFTVRGSGLDLVRAAFERADEHGLEVGWKPLGDPANKAGALITALTEGDYDLVVDDLPPINVGPKIGRRARLQAELSDAGSKSTAYRLVRDGPCGVVVVLDAVRMGLVTDEVLRAGVAASLAVGVAGAGGAAMASAGADSTMHQAALEQSANPVADAVAEVGLAPVPENLDITTLNQQDLVAMQQQLNHSIAVRDQKGQELDARQVELNAVEAELQQTLQAQEEAPRRSVAREYEARADELREAEEQLEAQQAETLAVFETASAIAESLQVYTTALHDFIDPVYAPTQDGYYFTSTFKQSGPYWSRGWHTGLDFANATGSDIYAARDGVVTQASWGGAYGNLVVIQHKDGTSTWYAHNSAVYVAPGQEVRAGQHIADMGATGNVTGPHLHFEVRDAAGNFLDPYTYLGL